MRFLAILLIAGSQVFAQYTNLVKNGGFEEGLFGGWRGSAKQASITTEAKIGAKALKVPSGALHEIVYQDIPVTAGRVYTISAWAKQVVTSGSGVAAVVYEYFNTPTISSTTKVLHRQFIQYIEHAHDWTQYKTVSLAPDSAVLLRLNLYVTAAAPTNVTTGYFDDVWVIQGEYMTNKVNLLTNPGFENGSTGWSDIQSNDVVTGERVHGGSKALKVTGNGGWNSFYQEVSAVPGDFFTFRGYVCTRSTSGDTARTNFSDWQFSFRDAAGSIIDSWIDIDYPKSYDWLLMAKDVRTAPAGTVKFRVEGWASPGSDIGYFDDTWLIKYAKAPAPAIRISPITSSTTAAGIGRFAAFDALGRIAAGKIGSGVYIIPGAPNQRKPAAHPFLDGK